MRVRASFLFMFLFTLVCGSAFAAENKPEAAPQKFLNAPFNEEQFTGKTVEIRKLAYIANVRAAQEVHDKCAEAMKAKPEYKTDEERTLAIKAYCPASPAPDGFWMKAIDVTCETGEYCGKEFQVDKRDLRQFKAYFDRKVRYVMEAKQLGIHMDKVCPYACNKAKAPDRLAQFWFVRCLEEWKDVE